MSRDVLATIDVDAESDEAFEQRVFAVYDLRDRARLAKLADDEQDAVRRAVASNPHTPVAVLEAMATDQRNARTGVLAGIALRMSATTCCGSSPTADRMSDTRSGTPSECVTCSPKQNTRHFPSRRGAWSWCQPIRV